MHGGNRLRFSNPQGPGSHGGAFGKPRSFAPSAEPEVRKDRQQMAVGFVMLAGAVLLFYVLLGQPTVSSGTGGNRPQQAQLEQLELEVKRLQKQVVPVPPVASGQAHLTTVPKASAPLYTQPAQGASATASGPGTTAPTTEAVDLDVCIIPKGNWDHTCIVGKTMLEGPCPRTAGQTKRCILKAMCKNSADEVVEAGFEYNAGDAISLNNMDGRLCRQGGQFECGVSKFYTLCPVERQVTTQPYSWGNINNSPPTVILPSPPVALKPEPEYDDDTDTEPLRRRRDPPRRAANDDDEQFEYRGTRRDRDRDNRREGRRDTWNTRGDKDRDWEHGEKDREWDRPRPRSRLLRGEDDDTHPPQPRRHRRHKADYDQY